MNISILKSDQVARLAGWPSSNSPTRIEPRPGWPRPPARVGCAVIRRPVLAHLKPGFMPFMTWSGKRVGVCGLGIGRDPG